MHVDKYFFVVIPTTIPPPTTTPGNFTGEIDFHDTIFTTVTAMLKYCRAYKKRQGRLAE